MTTNTHANSFNFHMDDISFLAAQCQIETYQQVLETAWKQTRIKVNWVSDCPGQIVLLVGADPQWWVAGTIYAAVTGRKYMLAKENWTAYENWTTYLTEAPNGLLLCGPREAFDYEHVTDLFLALQPSSLENYREEQKGVFAFLTAASLKVWLRIAQDTINWLPRALPTITYFLPLEEQNLLTEIREDMHFLNRKTANIAEIADREHDVLAITSHGTDDLLYIGSEDVICGFAGEINQIELEQGKLYPVCAYEKHCTRQGRRLRADHIRSKVTFLNSCMGLRFNDASYTNDFSLGLNFLNGSTTHLIAANQMKEGDSGEVAFFVQLLRAGTPLGEATRLVNNALFTTAMNAPCYILVGDPNTKITNSEITRQNVEVSQEGLLTICIEEPVPLLHLRIEGESWYGACLQRKLYFELYPSIKQELFMVALPHREGKQIDLYVFSFGNLVPSELRLQLCNWDQSLANRVGRALNQYYLASPKKIMPDKLKGTVDDIKGSSLRLARDWKSATIRSSVARDIGRQIRMLHEKLDRADRILADSYRTRMIQQPLSFTSAYDGWDLEQQQVTSEICYLSGHRLTKRVVHHPLLPNSTFYRFTCPKCGDILESTDERIALHLKGPNVFTVGEPIRQQLVIENRSSELLRGYASVLTRDLQFELQVEPDLVRIELAPGEQKVTDDFLLTYNADLIEAHLHGMKAFFVSDLSFYLGQKPFHMVRPISITKERIPYIKRSILSVRKNTETRRTQKLIE